jgi:serine/threonine protein kinase/WD40 repeat protein
MMTWNPRANELFLQAVELSSPGERQKYLDEACAGDAALHAEVEGLLEAGARAGSFLASPAAGLPSPLEAQGQGVRAAATVVAPAFAERPGTVIGPYKLLQQIGEGGMGTVFMAEQSQPVQRKVALKVIKAGMDSRQVIARFEAERQALAMMDHVNIARVLDAGATASGRPYFVMELVHGVPITEYCDDNRLTTRERLELFVPVCQAIQHAHQKGIIHRDVKPSNVMITLYDGKPVPKVIDFGVAKATEQKLTDRTLFTQYGTMVGTLEYMSPEQAEMSGLGVDTRSDIYSLGVLLYELLTGSTPLTQKRIKEAPYGEILRLIKEEEAPKPSTRLSDSGEALASISAQRKTEPAKLSKLMRGELDWIVMKTLDKDRNRRYATANGLAMDVQRYMADEPVQACPPSAGYRFRKFARRNRRLLATVSVVALALVLGTAISAWEAIRATEAEGLAQTRLQAESEAQNATREQLHLTQQAEDKARNRLYRSLVDQARASRLSQRSGQRFTTLEVLAEARQMARELNVADQAMEKELLELRNNAIACLAVADVQVAREWPGYGTHDHQVDFDGTLEHYAVTNRQGVCSVRRSADGTEIASLHGLHLRCSDGSAARPLFSRDGGYVAVWYYPSRALKMWKLGGAKPLLLVDEPAQVSTFNFSPGSRLFAFGLAGGSIQVIELASGRLRPRFQTGPLPQGLAFHPTRPQFAVASNGKKIRICDLDSGKVLTELPQAAGVEGPTTIDWHPQGNILAVGGWDHAIYLWDVATRKQIARLEGHKNFGLRFAFNHAGDLLASTCWDNTLRLWDPRTGQALFKTQASVPSLVRFSPDDNLLAASHSGNNLQLWQVAPAYYRTLLRDPVLGRGQYLKCATSPKSERLAVLMTDGVGLWDPSSGNPLTFLHVGRAYGVLFEPSGALLTNSPAGLLRWPIREDSAGKLVGGIGNPSYVLTIGPPQKLPLPGSINAIASSRAGRVVASAQRWGGLVWNQDLDGPPVRLSPHEDTRSISVSPDGRWVATGSHWGTKVKIWDTWQTRTETTLTPAHELPVETGSMVHFSQDGRWLATTGGGCRLWKVPSWQEGPHIGNKGMLAFSPDGKILAVETTSGVVQLLNPDTGLEFARLEDPNQDRAHDLAFTPEGAELVAINTDHHSIHVWDLRKIREQLAKMDLDWGLPPYPAADIPKRQPLGVTVDLGEPTRPAPDRLEIARQLIEEQRRALKAKPNDALTCNNLAWAYLTAPEALRDCKAALPLAEKAVQLEPKSIYQNTRGLAYYRAGRYSEAVKVLEANLKDQVDWGLPYDLHFLAMSYQKLGDSGRACQCYALAVRWAASQQAALAPYAVELAAVRAEAESVLGIHEPAQPKDKRPAPEKKDRPQ